MNAVKVKPKRLPHWADEWSDGEVCKCGSWTVVCYGMDGRRVVVCGSSGYSFGACPIPTVSATPTEEQQ